MLVQRVHIPFLEFGVLAIVFMLHFIVSRALQGHMLKKQMLGSVWTTGVLFLILSTGGVHSAYFYTLYFLLFALTMLVSSYGAMVVVISFCTYVVFFTSNGSIIETLSPLIGLLAITPFAVYLNIERNTVRTLTDKVSNSEQILEKDESMIAQLEDQSQILANLISDGPLKRLSDLLKNGIIEDETGIVSKEITEIETLLRDFEGDTTV